MRRPAKRLRRPLQLRLGFQLEMFDEPRALQERDGRARAGIEAALEEAIARASHEASPCACGCSPSKPHCRRCGQRRCDGRYPCACVDGGFESGDAEIDRAAAERLRQDERR